MRTLALLLVLTWAPLTAHCQLESVTGLELLQCPSGAQTPSSSHCDNSSCCDWETGQYRLPQNQSPVAAYWLALAPSEFTVIEVVSSPVFGSPVIQVTGPAELAVTWQFAFRAALPIRAPSIAS